MKITVENLVHAVPAQYFKGVRTLCGKLEAKYSLGFIVTDETRKEINCLSCHNQIRKADAAIRAERRRKSK